MKKKVEETKSKKSVLQKSNYDTQQKAFKLMTMENSSLEETKEILTMKELLGKSLKDIEKLFVESNVTVKQAEVIKQTLDLLVKRKKAVTKGMKEFFNNQTNKMKAALVEAVKGVKDTHAKNHRVQDAVDGRRKVYISHMQNAYDRKMAFVRDQEQLDLDMKEKLDEYRTIREKMGRKMQGLEETLQNIRSDVKLLEVENDELEFEKMRLQVKIEDLEKEIKSISQETEHIDLKKKELQECISAKIKAEDELHKKMSVQDSRIEFLNQKLAAFSLEFNSKKEKIKANLSETQQRLDSVSLRMNELSGNEISLKESRDKLVQQGKRLANEMKENSFEVWQQKVEEVKKKKETIEENLRNMKKTIESLQLEIEATKESIDNLNAQRKKRVDRIREGSIEITKKEKRLQEIQEKMQIVEEKKRNEDNVYKEFISQGKATIRQLKKNLESSENTYKMIVHELQTRKQSLYEELASKKSEIRQLEAKVKFINTRIDLNKSVATQSEKQSSQNIVKETEWKEFFVSQPGDDMSIDEELRKASSSSSQKLKRKTGVSIKQTKRMRK